MKEKDFGNAQEPQWIDRPFRFKPDKYDWISLSLVLAMMILLLVGHSTIFPVPPDGYYHLTVAREILDQKTIPTWNDWDFAPYGRPHLYPPLYHLILAAVAWLKEGDMIATYRLTQAVLLPSTYLVTWYFSRWFFGSKRALITLIIVGADVAVFYGNFMATPGAIAVAISSVAVIAFMSRRWWMAGPLFALAAYAHMAIAPLTVVALILFTLINRSYFSTLARTIIPALILAAPWYANVIPYTDWMSHPLESGIYQNLPDWPIWLTKIAWLQMVNLVAIALFLVAARRTRWREQRNQLILCCLLAFSPMLVGYGGRYYIHTYHLIAIVAATILVPLFNIKGAAKRSLALVGVALAPTVVFAGAGLPVRPMVYPMVSAWIIPPFIAGGGLNLMDGGKKIGLVSVNEIEAIAAYIRDNTTPDEILYFGHDRDLAIAVGLIADRPIDTGAWEETQPPKETRQLIQNMGRSHPESVRIVRSASGAHVIVGKEATAISVDSTHEKN